MAARGSEPVTISASTPSSSNRSSCQYCVAIRSLAAAARSISLRQVNLIDTCQLGAAAVSKLTNCRSVPTNAESGMLLTTPMVIEVDGSTTERATLPGRLPVGRCNSIDTHGPPQPMPTQTPDGAETLASVRQRSHNHSFSFHSFPE